MRRTVVSRLALVSAAAGFIAACSSSEGPVSPGSSRTAPDGPSYIASVAGQLNVCLAAGAPAGIYTFTPGGITNQQTGDATHVVVLNTITSPTVLCGIALDRVPVGANGQVATTAVTATTGAAGTWSYTCTDLGAAGCTAAGGSGNVATAGESSFHGSIITFTFTPIVHPPPPPPPDHGCTFTQGYYKNKGEDLSKAYDFDGGTDNGYDVLWTKPRGNPYYILAHQYITADLNLMGGAVMPPYVDAAFDAATAYYADPDVSPATPLGAGGTEYTKDEITGWSEILDDFNNGVSIGGPPHC